MEWFFSFSYDNSFFDKLIEQSGKYNLARHIYVRDNWMVARFPNAHMECAYEEIEQGLILNFARYSSTEQLPENSLIWLPSPGEEYYFLKLELSDRPATVSAFEKVLSKTGSGIPQSFLVSSGSYFKIKLEGGIKQDALLIGISMSRDFLLYYLQHLFPPGHPVLTEIKSGTFRYHRMQIDQAIFEEMDRLNKSDALSKNDKFAIKARVYSLLDRYFKKLLVYSEEEEAPVSRYYLEQMSYAREQLLAAVVSEVSPPAIAEISRTLGMSERKFETLFKSTYGVTYYNFFLQSRMDRAGELLAEGRYSVSEVARMVGYQHLGHFSRIFKRFHGCLPKEFKVF
ncbi:helix-turn-helix transcriptional regulator [Sinomicrobium sp. M5D2P17]